MSGTICILAIILLMLGVSSKGIVLISLFVLLSYSLQKDILTKITVKSMHVELEYIKFILFKSIKCIRKDDVESSYGRSVGPKGIAIMLFELRQLSADAVIAEIQPDLTGWKETDLITLNALLSNSNSTMPTAT